VFKAQPMHACATLGPSSPIDRTNPMTGERRHDIERIKNILRDQWPECNAGRHGSRLFIAVRFRRSLLKLACARGGAKWQDRMPSSELRECKFPQVLAGTVCGKQPAFSGRFRPGLQSPEFWDFGFAKVGLGRAHARILAPCKILYK
jgi:hypothetical protein